MTPSLFGKVRIVLAFAFLVPLMAAGCAKEESPPAPVVKKTVQQDAAKVDAAQPAAAVEGKSAAVELYNPAGKRDPFLAFLRVEKKEARSNMSSVPPLQRYELGELNFVGVIWGPDAARALVEDSEGKGYTVTVGVKIGREGGVVTRITENEIFVREEFRDYTGAKVERMNSLKLRTAGGK